MKSQINASAKSICLECCMHLFYDLQRHLFTNKHEIESQQISVLIVKIFVCTRLELWRVEDYSECEFCIKSILKVSW